MQIVGRLRCNLVCSVAIVPREVVTFVAGLRGVEEGLRHQFDVRVEVVRVLVVGAANRVFAGPLVARLLRHIKFEVARMLTEALLNLLQVDVVLRFEAQLLEIVLKRNVLIIDTVFVRFFIHLHKLEDEGIGGERKHTWHFLQESVAFDSAALFFTNGLLEQHWLLATHLLPRPAQADPL